MDAIVVECPYCGTRFETHGVGDIVACEACDREFARFSNATSQ